MLPSPIPETHPSMAVMRRSLSNELQTNPFPQTEIQIREQTPNSREPSPRTFANAPRATFDEAYR